jgi:hypothetical protein
LRVLDVLEARERAKAVKAAPVVAPVPETPLPPDMVRLHRIR